MKLSKNSLNAIRNRFQDPVTCFYAFAAFFVILFFTGGGSRDDIQSLIVLRPLSALFCAYAVTVKATEQWNGRVFPLYAVGAFIILMVLQLIPLPPSIWTSLPGRQIFADIAIIAGIDQPWRPLSLSPSKTLNTLFSLTVPMAAVMLYLNLNQEYRNRAITVIMVLCVVSAFWSVLQLAGPSRSPLYLYQITNFGNGVGLFANRNHQAVMLTSTIVMLGWYAASQRPRAKLASLKFYASVAAIFVLIPLIFVTGSRAGLLLMVPGVAFALFFIYVGPYAAENLSRKIRSNKQQALRLAPRQVFLSLGVLTVAGIAALSVLLSRSLAYDRLFGGNGLSEQRIEVLPTLFKMIHDYMPWGSGFGSFEHVYKIYEPLELLSPRYLNQAHNDWLQYAIEGGIAALLIAAVVFIWFLKRLKDLAENWNHSKHSKYRAIMSIAVLLIFLAASIIDYPLRVPSLIAIFVVMSCIFNDSVRAVQLSATK
ncbi:O-antigen ligase family protein [Sphingorhabdus sp. Alg231-15]|uniref:O-antigen ligase family protein n=1 Tax=Sphingorhabdus sp. Alg231-15 TaxID=1922222 RepID=UPI000D5529F6